MEQETEIYTAHGAIIGDPTLRLTDQGEDRYGRRMKYIGGVDLQALTVSVTLTRQSDLKVFPIARVDKSFGVVWLAETK